MSGDFSNNVFILKQCFLGAQFRWMGFISPPNISEILRVGGTIPKGTEEVRPNGGQEDRGCSESILDISGR